MATRPALPASPAAARQEASHRNSPMLLVGHSVRPDAHATLSEFTSVCPNWWRMLASVRRSPMDNALTAASSVAKAERMAEDHAARTSAGKSLVSNFSHHAHWPHDTVRVEAGSDR